MAVERIYYDRIQELEQEIKQLREDLELGDGNFSLLLDRHGRYKKKLEKIKELVNSHNGSDFHARQLFDSIEELLEK